MKLKGGISPVKPAPKYNIKRGGMPGGRCTGKNVSTTAVIKNRGHTEQQPSAERVLGPGGQVHEPLAVERENARLCFLAEAVRAQQEGHYLPLILMWPAGGLCYCCRAHSVSSHFEPAVFYVVSSILSVLFRAA